MCIMLWIVYFDDFHVDLERRLMQPYKLVRYDNIPANAKPSALIITGSKKRILRENDFPLLQKLIEKTSGKVIGICFGFQYLALLTGGTIIEDQKYKGIKNSHYYNHYDKVISLPKPWVVEERQDNFISCASLNNWRGFQFHPEKKQSDYIKYIKGLTNI